MTVIRINCRFVSRNPFLQMLPILFDRLRYIVDNIISNHHTSITQTKLKRPCPFNRMSFCYQTRMDLKLVQGSLICLQTHFVYRRYVGTATNVPVLPTSVCPQGLNPKETWIPQLDRRTVV